MPPLRADCQRHPALTRDATRRKRDDLQVRVLGEGYTPDDEEDSAVAEVSAVYVYQARYRTPLARATAGNLVLVEGIDATINKTATVVAEAYEEEVHIFR